MNLVASLSSLKANMYCYENGLKHININNDDGFSALFVVNTPVFDNSGVAHGVEHSVFRRSTVFSKPETLFQLSALTDVKINASTFSDNTYFHCHSLCSHSFILAVDYLLHGLFSPLFDNEDLHCEIYDGDNKGVIYRELIGIEQANKASSKEDTDNEFNYGGTSDTIGKLTLNDLNTFHRRFYQESNITLVTANADIKDITRLIARLPLQTKREQFRENDISSDFARAKEHGLSEQHKAKYSPEINALINVYHLSRQTTKPQQFVNYKKVKSEETVLSTNTKTLPSKASFSHSGDYKNDLIEQLIGLSSKLLKSANVKPKLNINRKGLAKSANEPLLPKLFTKLCKYAKKQLHVNGDLISKLPHSKFTDNEFTGKGSKVNSVLSTRQYDQHNSLFLALIGDKEKVVANISSYIISAYPAFLARRCQGFCYATQALVIEDSSYFAIYSAFDVAPEERLAEVAQILLRLSEDNDFIGVSLVLAKIKYCRSYRGNNSQGRHITTSDIAHFLRALVNKSVTN